MFESLDAKFDTQKTLPVVQERVVAYVPEPTLENDADFSRKAIRDMVERGTQAIDGILHIAESSEHPRAYEVAAQLIKVVSDTAKDLLTLQKIKKDVEGVKRTPIGTQNNLFVGSTNELLKALKKQKMELDEPSI